MELQEALASRRSVRAFEPTPLEQGQIDRLLEAACQAPSPLNLQPWRFLLIDDPGLKSRIRRQGEAAAQAVLSGGGPAWVKKYGFAFLEQAPLLILVLYDPKKNGLGTYFNQHTGALSAAAAAIQNLMLAAAEMGLGTLWFTFFDPGELAAMLEVPAGLEIAALVPVGVPAETPPAPPRKPAKVFRNGFGE